MFKREKKDVTEKQALVKEKKEKIPKKVKGDKVKEDVIKAREEVEKTKEDVKRVKEEAKKDVENKVKDKKDAVTNENGRVFALFSIKAKLIIAFAVPVIAFLVAGILVSQKCSSLLIDSSESAVASTVNTIAEYVSSGGEAAALITGRLQTDAAQCFTGTPTDNQKNNAKLSLANEAKADYLVSGISIIADGYATITNFGIKKGEAFSTFDSSAAGQYVNANNREATWVGRHEELDAITTFDSSSYALSYVCPFINMNNEFGGYIIVDVKSSYILDVLNKAELAEGSYVALVGNDGNEVVSGDGAFTFTDKDFYQAVKGSAEGGSTTVTSGGQDYMFVYAPAANVDAMICGIVPRASVLGGAQAIKMYLMIAVVLCAIIAILLGNYFAIDMGKAISKVNGDLQQTAKGDLTGELHLSRKDEFKTLSANIRAMKGSMKKLITKIGSVSGELVGSAGTVDDNSTLLRDVTQDITCAINEIDSGIAKQSEDTSNCLAQMEELASSIEVVQNNTSMISEITNSTRDAIDNGMTVVSELSDHVYETTDITKGIIDEITRLSEEAEAITGIITTIEDISDETNLLALNASIEAARAGEAGKGFAVVADNIRGFALRSNEAAGQIGDIVGKLQGRMDTAIETAKRAEIIVNNQETSLKTTIEVFNVMRSCIMELSGNLESITTSMYGIEKAKEDTLSAVESISSTSVQTGVSAAELNRIVERQLESVKQLGEAVVLLQQNASDLDEAISLFKV